MEARTGGAVAIAGGGGIGAGGDCKIETEENITENDTEEVEVTEDVEVIKDDEELEDRAGQPDDNMLDTSDLSTLPPEEGSSEDEPSAAGVTTQRS